jgi:hypothetical protein
LCTNVINVMGGAFRLWESISIWECISVTGGDFIMIMFMKREYIIRYSYTFHMLKIASNQCYERCFFSYDSCISLCVAAV